MVTLHSLKLVNTTCPHSDCEHSFTQPLHEKGILFCPYCHNSLLTTPPKTMDDLSKSYSSSLKNKSHQQLFRKTDYLTALILSFVSLAMILVLFSKVIPDNLSIAIVIIIVTAVQIKKGYSAYREKSLKPTAQLYAGVDKLEEVKDLVEFNASFNLQESQDFLLTKQPIHKNLLTNVTTVDTCPCCTSQMLASFIEMTIHDDDLYSKYNISRPDSLPNGVYCSQTQTYIEHDRRFWHIFLCLRCHTHFNLKKYRHVQTEHSSTDLSTQSKLASQGFAYYRSDTFFMALVLVVSLIYCYGTWQFNRYLRSHDINLINFLAHQSNIGVIIGYFIYLYVCYLLFLLIARIYSTKHGVMSKDRQLCIIKDTDSKVAT